MNSHLFLYGSTCVLVKNGMSGVNLSLRALSTTSSLNKNTAGKYKSRKPTHIGVSKGCMTFHSQNLEGFRQQQPITLAQDEIVHRFMRGIFYKHLTARGTEFVIKRRGNLLYVTGFLQYGRMVPNKVYWMIGFAEELLSNLLKQPVKLEIQFVEDEKKLYVTYV